MSNTRQHNTDKTDHTGTAQPTLEGVTLEAIVTTLSTELGWEALAAAVPIRCFTHDPSIKSSLTFLRRTPWARAKVEALYLRRLRLQHRARIATD